MLNTAGRGMGDLVGYRTVQTVRLRSALQKVAFFLLDDDL